MLQFYNYLIWFKVCKPIKRKYNLSVNCSLVLIGCYTYVKVMNKGFTLTKVVKFVSFFSSNKTKTYLKVLLYNGFIIESGLSYNKPIYILSPLGLSVIEELNNSYEVELRKFVDLYSIVL